MATRGRKKPTTKRKPRAASPDRSLATFGWIAAGLVGCAWAASDGRPIRYVSEAIDALGRTARPEDAVDRVAALIRSESTPKPAAPAHAAPPRPRTPASPAESAGAVRTSPKPVAEFPRPERPVPMPAKAPLPPLDAPPVVVALRQTRGATLSPASVPVGQQRHATRALAAHQAPDASSPASSEIASGSPVLVLRSAGDWRYVRDGRGGTEGWVDGRFLAGQSMSSDLAALTREHLTRDR